MRNLLFGIIPHFYFILKVLCAHSLHPESRGKLVSISGTTYVLFRVQNWFLIPRKASTAKHVQYLDSLIGKWKATTNYQIQGINENSILFPFAKEMFFSQIWSPGHTFFCIYHHMKKESCLKEGTMVIYDQTKEENVTGSGKTFSKTSVFDVIVLGKLS